MKKFPKTTAIKSGMYTDQAMFIDLYNILIEAGIITEQEAIERYETYKKRFGALTWTEQETQDASL